MAQRDSFFGSFDRVLKIVIAIGIILIGVPLTVLLANAIYNLTRSLEAEVMVIGCIVLVFGYLSYKIFSDL